MATIATRLVCSDTWNIGVDSTDDDGVDEIEWIGHVDDPRTADRVPSEMRDTFLEYCDDYADAVSFGAACRAQARGDYQECKGY